MSWHRNQRTQRITTPTTVGLVILRVPRLPEDGSPVPKHVVMILIMYCVLSFVFYWILLSVFVGQGIENFSKAQNRIFQCSVFRLKPNWKIINYFFFRITEITHSELYSVSVLEVTWRSHANHMIRASDSVANSMIIMNSHTTLAIIYSCSMMYLFFLHMLWNILNW
jgi:hypothetical protein